MEMAEGKPRELELILIAPVFPNFGTKHNFDLIVCIKEMCSVVCRRLLVV